jgi:hypothetical protein
MASRNDVVVSLQAGMKPAEIAERHKCSLVWVEIIAGKRTPEDAFSRRPRRQAETARRFIEWREAA